MTRKQMWIVEGMLVLGGLLFVFGILGFPFGGGGGGNDEGEAVAAVRTDSPSDGGATPADGAPEHTPAPDGVGDGCAPIIGRDFFSGNQVFAFYGNPYAESLGILGQLHGDELVARLRQQAAELDAANGFRGVLPAFHMVYGTAQTQPGEEGEYVLRVDDTTLQEYIDLACENGFLIFLDIQAGRADLFEEVRRLLPYLQYSNVQLSIDPEFRMHEGEVPGETIGSVDGDEVNQVQAIMQEYIEANGLPDKILIVHQFDERMVTNRTAIEDYPRVRLVMNMDGFGLPEAKAKKFITFAQPGEFSGIKLFTDQDDPHMTWEQVTELHPDVVMYQ